MTERLPVWFRADNVFDDQGLWYFGSADGLHLGPYPDRSIAETRSRQAVNRLRDAVSSSEQLKIADALMIEEQHFIQDASGDADLLLADVVEIDLPDAPVRSGELVRNWTRSERFFQLDGAWYFSTREGTDIGPYVSLSSAKQNAEALIAGLIVAKDQEEALQVIESHRTNSAVDANNIRFAGVRQFRRVY